jgi:ADP-ribosyl-[dinitrogen reductase] hydrolase
MALKTSEEQSWTTHNGK